MNVDVAVLAGGWDDERMEPVAALRLKKLDLDTSADTCIDHILDILERVPVRQVHVVCSDDTDLGSYVATWFDGPDARPNVDLLHAAAAAPTLSSIHVALARLPLDSDGLLVWPVAYSLVLEATVAALVQAFCATPHAVVVPWHNQDTGQPVIFAASVYEELRQATDGEGTTAVVQAHAMDRLQVPVPDWHIHTDITTPEAYRRWVEEPYFPAPRWDFHPRI